MLDRLALYLLIASCVMLAGCDALADRETEICHSATDGLPIRDYDACLSDLYRARVNAWHEAAQPYRNKERRKL